jgi:alginate O-acetyltransferase complex protein AlgI
LAAWHLPPWVFMWSVAVAMGLAGKWLTFRDALRRGCEARWPRIIGWFLAWPGLDGRAFFSAAQPLTNPIRVEWLAAWAKLLLGLALVWTAAPLALPHHPLLAGWLAMIGIVFCLHFGAFHLLSLLWCWAGVNAPPIMRNPIAATSVAEFWGARWNTAFSIPARRLVLMPLARRCGLGTATLLVFLLSGLLHELVISLPARGGWGLPTAYFALQACGLALERSIVGQRLHLASGWQGKLFTVVVTALPAFWLFHPPFVHQVILPMLQAIGAT